MIVLGMPQASAEAHSANATRPATAVVHDSTDARVIVFRIAPGQSVSPHRSASTVMLLVLSGRGIVTGGDGERAVTRGDLITYEPNELHGMHSTTEELSLVAIIAPRPGSQRAEPVSIGAV